LKQDSRDDAEQAKEAPQLTWSQTLALIIAAYEVLLPVVLALAGLMVLMYFIFRWIFL